MTCWRRLDEWNRAGVWQRLHELLLAELQAAGKLDWSRAVVDSSHVRAARRGPKVVRARSIAPAQAPNTTSLTEGAGIPLCAWLTGGNRNDITQLLPLIDKIPPVRGRRGRPRRRPDELYADRAYDHNKYRRLMHSKGIRTRIARRGQPHGSGLGKVRWVIERTIAWYHGMRRLRIRWERRDDIHEAFLSLATCIITYRHLTKLC